MKTKTALGIDPSTTATGLVLLQSAEDNPVCLFAKTLKPKTKRKGMERYRDLVTRIIEEIDAHKPDRIVVEGYSLNMKNASSVVPLVELGGLLRFMLYLDGTHWLDPRATELKKFVTGKGNSKKEAMMMHVLKRWGFEASDNDIADAYGLACMGLLHIGGLPNATQNQREIIGAVSLRCN